MEAVGNTRLDVADRDAGDISANGGAFLLEAFLPHALAVTAAHASRLFARRYAAAFGLNIAEWCVLAVVGQFGPIVPGAA